jgi:hypothetical protein
MGWSFFLVMPAKAGIHLPDHIHGLSWRRHRMDPSLRWGDEWVLEPIQFKHRVL